MGDFFSALLIYYPAFRKISISHAKDSNGHISHPPLALNEAVHQPQSFLDKEVRNRFLRLSMMQTSARAFLHRSNAKHADHLHLTHDWISSPALVRSRVAHLRLIQILSKPQSQASEHARSLLSCQEHYCSSSLLRLTEWMPKTG